jgi:hypothetical protein
MNSRTSRIFQVLKEPESLIVIIGIVVAGILAYFGIRDAKPEQVSQAILSILGGLAVARIIADYHAVERDKQLAEALSLLQKVGVSAGPSLRLRTELRPLGSRARNARDILIVGRTLGMVLSEIGFLQERLRNGATIRLVMLDPSNEAVIKAIRTFRETLVPDLQTSMEAVKLITKAAQRDEQLKVRFIDFVPTLSLAAIDSQLPDGHIVVELVPYQISTGSRPHLLYKAGENPVWFNYFRDIAEEIWRDAGRE